MISNKEYAFSFRPEFYNLNNAEEAKAFSALTTRGNVQIIDTILDQIKELIKLRNPSKKLSTEEYVTYTQTILNGKNSDLYGVWVYYRWNNTIVHILSKEEFIEVRTSRNQYKITQAERDTLASQKIGVIGLSVGLAIAVTMAIERICGEIRLADFDTLELSNLNRLRSGVQNLGLPKVVIASREIAEIDPYINIIIFPEGLTIENMNSFFGTGDNQLNLLVEVCDGLDMKIRSRYHAKKLRIPVVMDTNDRGMLDIERFDLEPERAILHGLAGDLNPDNIQNLTNEEKIPYILKMVGSDTISSRLKASMMEVEQTLNTWPQLASSVQLGGAITTDVCRRILLDQLHVSGRYYIDLDELITDTSSQLTVEHSYPVNPFEPLNQEQIRKMGNEYLLANPLAQQYAIPNAAEIDQLIDIAQAAPSAGNNQPWKWFCNNGRLVLFHDRYRSWSWGDYMEMGALMALGTALESVSLYAGKLGYKANITHVNNEQFPFVIAEIDFSSATPNQTNAHHLLIADNLLNRHTNRASGNGTPIDPEMIKSIRSEIEPYTFNYLSDADQLNRMGAIIAACDRMRLLHPQGHEEFFQEVRWSAEEAAKTRDGIEIASIELTESDKAAFAVAKDYNAIQYLYNMNLGNGFKKLSVKSMSTASGFGIVSIPEFNKQNLLGVGGNILRAWTIANMHGISFYPMLSPSFFFNRLIHGNGLYLPEQFKRELMDLHDEFQDLCKTDGSPVFMFRLAISNNKPLKTFRIQKEDIYIT